MTITDIERITVAVPFTPRCAKWNALLVHQWQVSEVIRLTTDAGFVGYGETLPHYTWGRVPEEAVVALKGKNPADYLGEDRLGAGLQMALYDVVGKALGVPAYRLFNLPKVREWCPIAWWNTKMGPEDLAEEAKAALSAGYVAHKFKARPWIDVYEQVERVSAVTPAHYRLDMDWNEMLLTAGNAAPVLQTLDTYERVAIYETPIPHRDAEGWAQLRRKTNRPLAAHFGVPPFPTAVRDETCDGFVVGGGVNSVLRQGTLSATFDKLFWLQLVGTGLTTALCTHLGAVLTHAQWPAVTCLNNYTDDLLATPLMIQNGFVRVPEAPGLGIEIDEEALTRYRMTPPYELPEEPHIITVTRPGNRKTHYATMNAGLALAEMRKRGLTPPAIPPIQCWEDHLLGNQPVQERGVRTDIWVDDGSKAWKELHQKALYVPIQE